MDDIESIEDICASLGLGHVPMLNEENRELNRKLQDLQVQGVPKKFFLRRRVIFLTLKEDCNIFVLNKTRVNGNIFKIKKVTHFLKKLFLEHPVKKNSCNNK